MSVIELNVGNCRNCYKCIRECPLKAIEFKNEHSSIMENACVLCGKCVLNCPQNAKYISSDVGKVKKAIAAGKRVYATVAPSYVSWGEGDFELLSARLKALGFAGVEETAIGARAVSRAYERLMREQKMDNVIVTACSSVVMLVERYFPELIGQLAPVPSPMMAHAKLMKEAYQDCEVAFIGPCYAKKKEIDDPLAGGLTDYVITFEQLDEWLDETKPAVEPDAEAAGVSEPVMRLYPKPTGIIKTVRFEEGFAYHPIAVDGLDRCMELFRSVVEQGTTGLFIEANTCAGGCIGGPVLRGRNKLCIINETKLSAEPKPRDNTPVPTASAKLLAGRRFLDRSVQEKKPSEDEIALILAKIGKTTPAQELNCGCCGYPTCRDKAVAVYQGKADINMCLPFFRERAENLSSTVIEHSPNGIVAFDDQLCVLDINPAAEEVFGVEKSEAVTKPLAAFYGEAGFAEAHDAESPIVKKVEFGGKTLDVTFLFVKQHGMFLTVIKDITDEEIQEKKLEQMRANTVEIAQNVIDKQMRVAQEIASLLGETTAETKVALTNLKKSMDEQK